MPCLLLFLKFRMLKFVGTAGCLLIIFGSAACQTQTPEAAVDQPALMTAPATQPVTVHLPPVLPARPEFPLTGIEIYAADPDFGQDQAIRLGAYWLRRNVVLWSEIEPQEGQRNWEKLAALDRELETAAERQLEVILVVRSTPPWAQLVSGSYCGPVLPDKLNAFATFMHDLVARYSGAPYDVRYWEMGNEPDVDPSLVAGDSNFGCWGDSADSYYGGARYAEMLRQVYPEIRAADPEAQVLVGGLLLDCDPANPPEGHSCAPANFLEGILIGGGGEFFDGVSFHAYDYYFEPGKYGNPNWFSASNTSGPVVELKARFLRRVLSKYGYEDKYLFNTEAGLLCGRSGEEPPCLEQAFQLTKAQYAVISNASAAALGLRGNLWFSLTGWRGSGMLSLPDLQPFPLYDAFRFSSSMLNGAIYLRTIDEFPGLKGYEFILEGKQFWILWSPEGSEQSLPLPAEPFEVYDFRGVPQNTAQGLKLSAAPLYIVFEP